MPLPILGRVRKNVTGVIGLGQEAYQHNKEKKAANDEQDQQQQQQQQQEEEEGFRSEGVEGSSASKDEPPSYDDIDFDEDDWTADEAQQHLQPAEAPPTTSSEADAIKDTLAWFHCRHPSPANITPLKSPLPGPVVVPQKRPDSRTRGFVRAYAPALEAAGVDQSAFLDFIAGFEKEVTGQKWYNVSNLAIATSVIAYTAAQGPSLIVKFSAMAVHISVEAGRRLYMSKKQNSYLDEMNTTYFQPRGLYAMIMAYKPGTDDALVETDFESSAAAAVGKRTGEEHSKLGDFKASSGKTRDRQIPETCPLIYPGLEHGSEEQKKNAFSRAFTFTRDYYDRRSQAEFASKHPDSGIKMQEHEFAGKYADPRNFENSGLLGIASGNRFDPAGRRIQRKNQRRVDMGRQSRQQGGGRGRTGLIKRMISDDVLYLMVVNMPSEEELREAKEAVEQMKAAKARGS